MKRIAILLSVIAASSAALAIYDNDTVLGFHALYDSSSTSGNIAIGESAGQEIYKGYNNIIIGNESLFDTHYCYNNIIIGNNIANSANDLRNCINIGGWLNNGRLMDDSVILGDSFFSTKQGGGIFGIGYDNSMSLTNSIIYYKFGTLYFNAKEVVGLPSAGGGYYTGYDLYLSPLGRDDNSGTDAAHPLRTIDACYAKAKTNATVCVFAGEYRFPKSYTNYPTFPSPSWDAMQFILTNGKVLSFVAVDGKERTFLIGDQHEGTDADYNYSSLAFDCDDFTLIQGFTIKGLTCVMPSAKSASSSGKYNRPIASGVWFKDCSIVNSTTNEYTTVHMRNWGGFQNVVFENTDIRGLHFDYRKLTNAAPLFWYCYFFDSRVLHCKYTTDRLSDNCNLVDGKLVAERCAFDLDCQDIVNFKPRKAGSTCVYTDCTLRSTQKNTYHNWAFDFSWSGISATNCYLIADLDLQYLATSNGVNCVGATAYTNGFVDAELKPNDVQCRAVRADGSGDAGYFESGLAGRKAMWVISTSPFFVYDSYNNRLNVYFLGEHIGVINMDSPEPQVTLTRSRLGISAVHSFSATPPYDEEHYNENEWNYDGESGDEPCYLDAFSEPVR